MAEEQTTTITPVQEEELTTITPSPTPLRSMSTNRSTKPPRSNTAFALSLLGGVFILLPLAFILYLRMEDKCSYPVSSDCSYGKIIALLISLGIGITLLVFNVKRR